MTIVSWQTLAKLPAVVTACTGDKGCHRFISTSGLHLVVSSLHRLALPTLEHTNIALFLLGVDSLDVSVVDPLSFLGLSIWSIGP